MIKKTTLLKTAAALTAGLLLFSCDPTQKEIELSVSDKSVSFETAGGDKTVTITCNDSWTVNSTADWITVSPKSGSDNGSIKITATANTGFEVRSADITVSAGDKSQTIKVNQLSLSPSLLIDPSATEVGYAGGEIELKITSNAPWKILLPANETSPWATPDKESGENSATVKVTVQPNLDRAVRTTSLDVVETIGNTAKTLTITQEMAPLSRRSDSLALVAIYNASKGAEWTKNNWDLTKPINEWSGVTLTKDRVTALKLSTSGVIPAEWTLPEAVGDLTELTDLRINSNKLTGEIPDVVYDLTKLEKLYFQNDNLTGALSPKLAQLTELTELYVDRNANMTGSIPKEIGTLKKLARINISQTDIGGEIPAELGQCDALLQFMAFKTKLSGELPDIWDMPVLQTVMLHTNPGITGNLPASLSKLKPLASGTAPSIQIYGCNLTGTIPDCFAELPEGTKQVQVQDNKMSGVISLTVQAHPNFASWKYTPQQEGYGLTLEQVNYRQLDSLALVAIYDASKGAEWTKNNWDLAKPMNEWSGVTLANGRVTALKLTVSGVIPSEWTLPDAVGDLTELTDLRINSNKLTGEIPDAVYGLTKLEKLYFQNDNLTGALSPKLAQLTELTELYVDRNANMTGSIPKEIGNLKKLARINISQSGIGGEIPAELGQCTALLQFMAFKAKLSGTLPDIWDMPVLQTVMLYGNPGLTGDLPASLGKLKPIVNGSTTTAPSLQLHECNFTGNIPESFAGLHEKTKQVFLDKNKMSGVVPASVVAHPLFSSWRISPQQDGYGLTTE